MRTLFACGLVILASSGLRAQNTPPQPLPFRTGVHAVEIDVRVFDERGAFVRELLPADFELLEDGTPQQLQSVYLVSPATPQRSSGRPPSIADSVSATGSASIGFSPRHTWIFTFDLNHLTPGASFERARAAVEEFIRSRFVEGDLGGVVAGGTMANKRLTTDREELLSSLQGLKPIDASRRRSREMTREWPRLLNDEEVFQIASERRDAIERAVVRACSDEPSACRQAPVDLEVREKARRLKSTGQQLTQQTLAALHALASGLARIPGPKTIVLLSEGFVTTELESTLRSTAGQAARSGARVYAIDVRGRDRGEADIAAQSTVTDAAGAFAQTDVSDDGPHSLAVETGGLGIRYENSMSRALDTIAGDAREYYLLGYEPTNTNWDGAHRSVTVRVRRQGLRVRARRGYVALQPARLLTAHPAAPARLESPEPPAAVAPANRLEATYERSREERPADSDSTPLYESRGAAHPPLGQGSPVISAPAGIAPPATAGLAASARALRLRPDTVRALGGPDVAGAASEAAQGWNAYQRGDLEAAVGPLSKAAADPLSRPWVHYALGLTYAGLGRSQDAVVAWEHVRATAPDFAPVYDDLAATYAQSSDFSKALAVLRAAEMRWPANPDIHNAIGVIHVRRGALDAGISAFSRAVRVAPRNDLAHFNLARTYHLRYARGARYVASQRRWVRPDDDRRSAAEHYDTCVQLGGTYAQQAAEALSLLEWAKQ